MPGYLSPRPLERRHRVASFLCRSSEQQRWLRRHARQSASMGLTRVFVVTPPESETVVAYYAWTMAHVEQSNAPARLLRGAGRYPQPVALLARLGVDTAHEGQGLGAALLRDALLRLHSLSSEIGCRGLLIHAETDTARAFYLHLLPELLSSPTDPLHLFLLMKDLRKTLAAR